MIKTLKWMHENLFYSIELYQDFLWFSPSALEYTAAWALEMWLNQTFSPPSSNSTHKNQYPCWLLMIGRLLKKAREIWALRPRHTPPPSIYDAIFSHLLLLIQLLHSTPLITRVLPQWQDSPVQPYIDSFIHSSHHQRFIEHLLDVKDHVRY